MGRTYTEQVDITIHPLAQRNNPEGYRNGNFYPPGTVLAWGDLHGNALKLIFQLIKEGVVVGRYHSDGSFWPISQADYEFFVAVYAHADDDPSHFSPQERALRKAELEEFNRRVEAFVFNPNLAVLNLGDEACDRGKRDDLTEKVLYEMTKRQVLVRPDELIGSNHGWEFYQRFQNGQKFDTGTGIVPNGGWAPQTQSALNLDAWIKARLVSRGDVTTMVNGVYNNPLSFKLLSYIFDASSRTLIPCTHAPVGLGDDNSPNNIEILATQWGIKYKDDTPEALACTIDAINEEFAKYLRQGGQLKDLYTEWWDEPPSPLDPITFVIWNRNKPESGRVHRPAQRNGYNLQYIHGHDKRTYADEAGHVFNLDNELGKIYDPKYNQGEYTVFAAQHHQIRPQPTDLAERLSIRVLSDSDIDQLNKQVQLAYAGSSSPLPSPEDEAFKIFRYTSCRVDDKTYEMGGNPLDTWTPSVFSNKRTLYIIYDSNASRNRNDAKVWYFLNGEWKYQVKTREWAQRYQGLNENQRVENVRRDLGIENPKAYSSEDYESALAQYNRGCNALKLQGQRIADNCVRRKPLSAEMQQALGQVGLNPGIVPALVNIVRELPLFLPRQRRAVYDAIMFVLCAIGKGYSREAILPLLQKISELYPDKIPAHLLNVGGPSSAPIPTNVPAQPTPSPHVSPSNSGSNPPHVTTAASGWTIVNPSSSSDANSSSLSTSSSPLPSSSTFPPPSTPTPKPATPPPAPPSRPHQEFVLDPVAQNLNGVMFSLLGSGNLRNGWQAIAEEKKIQNYHPLNNSFLAVEKNGKIEIIQGRTEIEAYLGTYQDNHGVGAILRGANPQKALEKTGTPLFLADPFIGRIMPLPMGKEGIAPTPDQINQGMHAWSAIIGTGYFIQNVPSPSLGGSLPTPRGRGPGSPPATPLGTMTHGPSSANPAVSAIPASSPLPLQPSPNTLQFFVLNGHGGMLSSKFLIDERHAVVTAGSPNTGNTLAVDRHRHIETVTTQGNMPKLNGNIPWLVSHNVEINDRTITNIEGNFNRNIFFNHLLNSTFPNEKWKDIAKNQNYHPLDRGFLAIEIEGRIQIKQGRAEIEEFLRKFQDEKDEEKAKRAFGTPIFFADPTIGKIKPCSPTQLSKIYEGIKLYSARTGIPTAILVATCATAGSEDPTISVDFNAPVSFAEGITGWNGFNAALSSGPSPSSSSSSPSSSSFSMGSSSSSSTSSLSSSSSSMGSSSSSSTSSLSSSSSSMGSSSSSSTSSPSSASSLSSSSSPSSAGLSSGPSMFSSPSSTSAPHTPPKATVEIKQPWKDFITKLTKNAEESSRSVGGSASSSDNIAAAPEVQRYIKAFKEGKLELQKGVHIEQDKEGNARGVVAIGTPNVVEGVNAIVDEFKKAGILAVHIYVKSTTDVAKDQENRMEVIRHALDQEVIPILKGINAKGVEESGQNSLLGTLLLLYRQEKKQGSSITYFNQYLDLVIENEKAFEELLKDLELDDTALKQIGKKCLKDEKISLDDFKQQLKALREMATDEKGKATDTAMDNLQNILDHVAASLASTNSAKHRDTSMLGKVAGKSGSSTHPSESHPNRRSFGKHSSGTAG